MEVLLQGVERGKCTNFMWDLEERSGSRHLAFINGPFGRIADILKKIMRERVDCVIITPEWPRHWTAMLQIMQQQGVVMESWLLPHNQGLVRRREARSGH